MIASRLLMEQVSELLVLGIDVLEHICLLLSVKGFLFGILLVLVVHGLHDLAGDGVLASVFSRGSLENLRWVLGFWDVILRSLGDGTV